MRGRARNTGTMSWDACGSQVGKHCGFPVRLRVPVPCPLPRPPGQLPLALADTGAILAPSSVTWRTSPPPAVSGCCRTPYSGWPPPAPREHLRSRLRSLSRSGVLDRPAGCESRSVFGGGCKSKRSAGSGLVGPMEPTPQAAAVGPTSTFDEISISHGCGSQSGNVAQTNSESPSSAVGSCQGKGREFEPRLPLHSVIRIRNGPASVNLDRVGRRREYVSRNS